MRLINLTRNRKQRLLTMLKGLVPEYNSIRITKVKGLPIVIFKKQWWKFWTRYTVNITDICVSEIPNRLDQLAQDKNLGKYRAFFSNIIYDIITFKQNAHTQHVDIIDYLWEHYEKIYYHGKVIVIPLSGKNVLVRSNYLPIPFTNQVRSFSINDIIKDIPEYFKVTKVKESKVILPKDTPPSIVRHIYLSISSYLREINIDLGFRTALN